MTQIGHLVLSGTCGVDVPVLIRIVILFDSRVNWMGCVDLKFKSLSFSVNVVVASVGGGRLVEKVEEDSDEDEGSSKGIEHERV